MLTHGLINNFSFILLKVWREAVLKNEEITLKGGMFMTNMQAMYADIVEKHRANVAQENLRAAELNETRRSHLVNEALSKEDLKEKIRHQIAQDTETMRNHLVTEAEIAQHNRNTESLMASQNAIAAMGHQLSYKAQHERNINEREIAEMNNETNVFLGLLRNRIDQMNAGSEQKKAIAALNSAEGTIARGQAALQDAMTRADLASSEKFKNYATGAHQITGAVRDVSDVAQDWMPTGQVSNAAGKVSKDLGANLKNTNTNKTAAIGGRGAKIKEIKSSKAPLTPSGTVTFNGGNSYGK